ncbi:MAG: hypothetical protein KUG81_01100 [Gammaproteobacteria bacterium]|nr:hypothetical protein [Gammaproteobacteria bacterium]
MSKIAIFIPLVLSALLTACGDNTSQKMPSITVENISSDTTIQAAYAGCNRDMAQGMIADNPGTEQDILQLMLQPIPDICHGSVVKPCEKDLNGFLCKTMIAEYKDK